MSAEASSCVLPRCLGVRRFKFPAEPAWLALCLGQLLAEWVLAMKHGLGLNKVLGTIHAYPTMAEANKYAAGEWKKANKPERLLRWVERFHDWRRG